LQRLLLLQLFLRKKVLNLKLYNHPFEVFLLLFAKLML
jgi:hypothetical protein